MPRFVPGGDAEFGAWLDNFVTCANGHLAGTGLIVADMTPTTTAQFDVKNGLPGARHGGGAISTAGQWCGV